MTPIHEALALLRPHSPRVVLSQWADAGLWQASILDAGKFLVDVKGKTLDEAMANLVTAARKLAPADRVTISMPPSHAMTVTPVEFEELF